MRLETKQSKSGYLELCAFCDDLVLADDDPVWQGENEKGQGIWMVTYRCEGCGRWRQDIETE
jgi:hypothetical protein